MPHLHRARHVVAKHHLKPSDVALRAIRDKDLLGRDFPIIQNIGDLLPQWPLALLCSVPRVGVLRSQFGHSVGQAREDVRRHRLCRVTDAKADYLGVRVFLEVGVAATAESGKRYPA